MPIKWHFFEDWALRLLFYQKNSKISFFLGPKGEYEICDRLSRTRWRFWENCQRIRIIRKIEIRFEGGWAFDAYGNHRVEMHESFQDPGANGVKLCPDLESKDVQLFNWITVYCSASDCRWFSPVQPSFVQFAWLRRYLRRVGLLKCSIIRGFLPRKRP